MIGIQEKIAGFCDVFPPGINSLTSFVVNLPIIMLWVITIPPRTFLCILSSVTQIPILGLIANLFPPSTIFCSLTSGNSLSCQPCNSYCNLSGECVGLPQSYQNFCQKTLPYFSIFNEIFCLLGYIIAVLLIPVITLINIPLSFIGKQICLSVNPNNCIPPSGG
jgi:hypothetical protein